jgi:hypothetical protein
LKKLVILHLGNYLLKPNSGVAQKTFSLADAIRQRGWEVRLVAISTSSIPEDFSHRVEVYTTRKADFLNVALSFFETLSSDCVVLVRYPFASEQLVLLTERFGKQIIFEHNTIEQAEMLLMQREHFSRQPFAFRWSYLKYAVQTLFLNSTVESRLGPRILQNVLGGICVSEEIQHYEQTRCKGYASVVVANGANGFLINEVRSPDFQSELRVAMLIGSDAIWHGYERLIHGLSQTGIPLHIRIDIVGIEKPNSLQLQDIGPHSIHWHGPKSAEELRILLQDSHMAAGTLALYKKSMEEASPLKVRECLMLGLPMIIGYYDTDVSSDERFAPYLFNVNNTAEPIDWKSVVGFYSRLAKDGLHRQKIADLALETLSMQSKSYRYLQFIEQVSN